MKIKWRLVVGIGSLLIALGLFGLASCYEQKISEYENLLAQVEGHPFAGYNFYANAINRMRATVPTLAAAGTILFLAASFCVLTSTKLLGLILMLLLSTVLISSWRETYD